MEQKRRNQDGFTLIEVLVSLAILGIVIMPIAAFFSNSVHYNQISKKQLQANQIAQSYIENYKSKSFSELNTIINNGSFGMMPPIHDTGNRVDIQVKVEAVKSVSDISYSHTFYNFSAYDGETLTLIADDTSNTVALMSSSVVESFASDFASPVKVKFKLPDAALPLSGGITINIDNQTAQKLEIYHEAGDKLLFVPTLGDNAVIVLGSEPTPESSAQEQGAKITVWVLPLNDTDLADAITELSVVKMAN
ncbi:type II secretion system GspH family protein [Dehalobacter sp. DCM]|uniref:type IV pilus modification PilV family protein n=1 Tax=Dehalobacter sp. DCM TaxID=2907827 RepID=UPI003081889F|nr:type II secretion system GspH family protein [Dehalobacter sp. DCM]